MSRELREVVADWLMLLGAVTLLVALFLPWSYQQPLPGFPRTQTAWEAYSAVDVLLAALAGALLAVALLGGRYARVVVLLAAGAAAAFTVHALSVPPSNGAAAGSPGSGAGEVVAIVALGLGIAGLALSFTAESILD